MPCYYTGSAEGDAQLAAEEARKSFTETTQLLCLLCQAIEDVQDSKERFLFPWPSKVKSWWKKHKKIDAKRHGEEKQKEEQEKLKKSALSKLTPEEKKALKIK